MNLSGETQVYGIIGDPVAHSLSPVFQSRFIEQAGLNAVYVPFHVKSGEAVSALDGLLTLGVEGFNITVPHKQDVFDIVRADTDAACIGAVNTVKHSGDGWLATNTDWQGVHDVLVGLGMDMEKTEVLMFGAGGTARAIAHALAHAKAARLRICNRSEERLQELIGHVREKYPDMSVETVAWEQREVDDASSRSALLINTTSIGLDVESGAFPFDLSGEGMAMDAVYAADGATAFVAAAGKAGRPAMDGLAMLVAQGAASFCFWHEKQPEKLSTLRWLEAKLGHPAAMLPAWDVTSQMAKRHLDARRSES